MKRIKVLATRFRVKETKSRRLRKGNLKGSKIERYFIRKPLD